MFTPFCDTLSCAGGKVLRHTEVNLDIFTWTRLLGGATTSGGSNSESAISPMTMGSSPEGLKSKQTPTHGPSGNGETNNESPPMSPLTLHSGESTPKSPFTPGKDSSAPMNGELPPPIPINEDDMVTAPKSNDVIIPPPQEFSESGDDLGRRRSEGSLPSPASTGGRYGAPPPGDQGAFFTPQPNARNHVPSPHHHHHHHPPQQPPPPQPRHQQHHSSSHHNRDVHHSYDHSGHAHQGVPVRIGNRLCTV